jgi:hypothetical protein
MIRGDFSFDKKFVPEEHTTKGGFTSKEKVHVTFIDDHNSVHLVKHYSRVYCSDIYEKIIKGESINLSECYVQNFSLSEIRAQLGLENSDFVDFKGIDASDSFFEADDTVDFSYAKISDTVNFESCFFGNGNVSFYQAKFLDCKVNFSKSFLGKGHTIFQYVKFGNGDKSFDKLSNVGNLSFINSDFGNGLLSFKEVAFGSGVIEFHFSRFGNSDISFDKSVFEGKRVDFRKCEFLDGKKDFRRVDFGNAHINFDESEFGKGKVNFRRSIFGDGPVSFELCNFKNEEVLFQGAEFGSGNLSFKGAKAGKISFNTCQLNNYIDFRFESCGTLDLSDTIVRDVVDFKKGKYPVLIDKLNLINVRNLGKLILEWDENKLEDAIASQSSTLKEKADQFRLLKEDFGTSGQYEDEDKAYVTFKRYELKYLHEQRLAEGGLKKILAYPMKWSNQLVFDKMGVYATDPARVLLSMIVTYVIFSLVYLGMIYLEWGELRPGFDPAENLSTFAVSFYHSAITFLTIGYGDYAPWGAIRFVSSLEGFVGLFLMSYFTVAFVRKILR